MHSRTKGIVAALAGLLVVGGCQDLDVANLNDPDRERALANPSDVSVLAGSAFHSVFEAIGHNPGSNSVLNHFLNYGTQMTTTENNWSLMQEMAEPRRALDNDPSISVIGPQGPRFLWRDLLTSASISYDVLNLVDSEGLVLIDPDDNDITLRTSALLKLVQGIAWGYLGVIYDQAPVLDESMTIAQNTRVQMLELMTPYREVIAAAVESLDAAIALAAQGSFSFPVYPDETLWIGSYEPVTNAQLARIANTLAARFLVLAARTPAERREVDWQRVLAYTANGVTDDFEVAVASGFRSSDVYSRLQSNSLYRWDMRFLGHGDVSGQHQAWIATSNEGKDRYEMVTPDRRITGPTPDSHGAYTRWRSNNQGFEAAFGSHLFSAYQWRRHAHEVGISPTSGSTGNNTGSVRLVTVDENRLYRAEALIYTGKLQAAADLINVTRTRAHTLPDGVTYPGLPPVTPAGAPHSAAGADDCVPRNDDGTCGDLMAALWWERMIENEGLDGLRGFADSRAFGLFVDGSYLHFPVPGNEADVIGMPFYTFGGVGTEWGAVYAPVTMGNVQ